EMESELGKNKHYKRLKKLEAKLKHLHDKFSKIVQQRFEPIRIKISVLESTAKDKKKLEQLKAERDEIWAKELAPLEKQKDLLLHKIQTIKQDPSIKAITKKYQPRIARLEAKKARFARQLEQLNASITSREQDLESLKSSMPYLEIKQSYNAQIQKLHKRIEAIQKRIERCNKSIKVMQDRYNAKLEEEGIKDKLEGIETRIKGLERDIKSKGVKQEEGYLEHLNQKRDYLLVSAGVYNKLIEIDTALGKIYERMGNEEGLAKQRELINKLNSKLKEVGIFEEYYSLKHRIMQLEQKLAALDTY
ncbi:hypothetical protein DRJ48_04795, partial [Candidatus Woesearchaeota archaeon]